MSQDVEALCKALQTIIGSNGDRDYMRAIARVALAAPTRAAEPPSGEPFLPTPGVVDPNRFGVCWNDAQIAVYRDQWRAYRAAAPLEQGDCTVQIPLNEDHAAAMAMCGLAWLKQHKSSRLKLPQAASAAPPQSDGTFLPRGVYYNLDADNFYDTDGNCMTHAFYREWQPRCMSFPKSRIEASLNDLATRPTSPQAAPESIDFETIRDLVINGGTEAMMRDAELAQARTLLKRADSLIHNATWAAGKLNVEMVHRRTIARRAELEALVEQRDAMFDWIKDARAFDDALAPRPVSMQAATPQQALAIDHLRWLLPMAKAYAREHPVGRNQALIDEVVTLFDEPWDPSPQAASAALPELPIYTKADAEALCEIARAGALHGRRLQDQERPIAELQAEIGRLQGIVTRRVCGDPTVDIGLNVRAPGRAKGARGDHDRGDDPFLLQARSLACHLRFAPGSRSSVVERDQSRQMSQSQITNRRASEEELVMATMRPLYIFDLDGTLALIEHRRHLVEGPVKDWRSFFAACVDDVPNLPVIHTLQALRKSGAEIWIWSGRSDEVRAETVAWLCKNGCFGFPTNTLPAWPFGAPERFRMRKAGDHRDDVALKSGWLSEIEPPEYGRLTAVFDDRARVVQMWRDAGVVCFQVAPGEF